MEELKPLLCTTRWLQIRRAIAEGEAGPRSAPCLAKDMGAVLRVNNRRAPHILRGEGLLDFHVAGANGGRYSSTERLSSARNPILTVRSTEVVRLALSSGHPILRHCPPLGPWALPPQIPPLRIPRTRSGATDPINHSSL